MVVFCVFSRDYSESFELVAIFTEEDTAIRYARITTKPLTTVRKYTVDDPSTLLELRNYDLICGKGIEVIIV